MRHIAMVLLAFVLLFFSAGSARCEVYALLVACREFLTAPSLGYDSSANLQTLAACLTLSGVNGARIRLEDGTVSSPSDLSEAARLAFSDAKVDDTCLLYLCTHGFPEPYMLLSDGRSEAGLRPAELRDLLITLPGSKLVILDACSSGAFLDFFARQSKPDPEITVLTSCSASEQSWYSAGKHLATGAISYFVHALCTGLGLYGFPEADANEDGKISPHELFSFMLNASALSTPCLLPRSASFPALPVVISPLPERAMTNFSFCDQILSPEKSEIVLSCTIRRETEVLYRIIEYRNGEWDWPGASVFSGGSAETGRLSQTIHLNGAEAGDYYALQVYSLEEGYAALCASRLFAVCSPFPVSFLPSSNPLSEFTADVLRVCLPAPSLLTCERVSRSGEVLSVLCRAHLFLPDQDGIVWLYPNDPTVSLKDEEEAVWRITADFGNGQCVTMMLNSFMIKQTPSSSLP